MATRTGHGATAFSLACVFILPFFGASVVILVACCAAAAIALLLLRNRTTLLLAIWFVVVLAVPPWISFQLAGFRLPVAAAISVAIVIVLVGKHQTRWVLSDSLVVALILTAVLASAIFDSPIHLATQVMLEWGCCYAAGRVLYKADFVVIGNRLGGMLGWLAIGQAFYKYNVANIFPFSLLSTDSPWSALQERGGEVRAELTLGHSIALGAVLTMLLPFALRKSRTLIDKTMIAGIGLGTIATFSRSAMVAALVVVVLTILVSKLDAVRKVAVSAACAIAAFGVLRYFTDTVGSTRNSVELTDSTAYREGLLGLIGQVRLIGLADGARPAPDGVTYVWGTYYSIDNGLLYLGLYLGLVAAAIFLGVLMWVARRAVASRQHTILIVLASQVPFILTVAPITQYQNVLWLLIGAAAQRFSDSGQTAHKRTTNNRVRAGETRVPAERSEQRERMELAQAEVGGAERDGRQRQ